MTNANLFSSFEDSDFSVGKGEDREKLNFLGGKKTQWPLDVRVVINPLGEEALPYHETHMHDLMIGDKYSTIPCNRSMGKTCSICDASWDHKEKADNLEATGAKQETSKNHESWKKHMTLSKLFQQKKKYSILTVVRGENRFSVLQAGPALTKAVFGDKRKNEKGAIDEVKSYNVTVYNPFEPTGWVTMKRAGSGLNTVYSANASVTVQMNGKKKEELLTEEALHPTILERLGTPETMPKLKELFKSKAWSDEELQAYVDSGGSAVPDRVMKYLGDGPAQGASEASKPKIQTTEFDASDLDPF